MGWRRSVEIKVDTFARLSRAHVGMLRELGERVEALEKQLEPRATLWNRLTRAIDAAERAEAAADDITEELQAMKAVLTCEEAVDQVETFARHRIESLKKQIGEVVGAAEAPALRALRVVLVDHRAARLARDAARYAASDDNGRGR